MLDDAIAVAFGVVFPGVFFLLVLVGPLELDTAFRLAKWSGLGLIGFYGFCAGRLAGASVTTLAAPGRRRDGDRRRGDRVQGPHPLTPDRAPSADYPGGRFHGPAPSGGG